VGSRKEPARTARQNPGPTPSLTNFEDSSLVALPTERKEPVKVSEQRRKL
jgi:hypothetical protein